MSAVTVNTFPSINAFTSARSWFLAIIVLLHVGFFWALSNGLSVGSIVEIPRRTVAEFFPAPPKPVEPLKNPVVDEKIIDPTIWVPDPIEPRARLDDATTAPEQVTHVRPPPAPPTVTGAEPKPTIVEPEIDPRAGLSEPAYPPAAIRRNETGTVMLSVLVLENGRIGEVRIEQSSGYKLLDEAAVKEARRWRLKPGTRDGAPVRMWKQIPIKFELRDDVRF